MKIVIVAVAVLMLAGSASAQIADLIISEYIEGSAYNKALEIYNGTDSRVNLASYTLAVYTNGSTIPSVIALGNGNINERDVFVIANPSAAAAILSETDLTSSLLNFNGNDALVLLMDGQVIDSLGQVGADPGTGWSCDGGSTYNTTLRRQDSVCAGNTITTDEFNPCLEYDFFANDTLDGLGYHADDCQSVLNDRPSWDSLKASFK